MSTLVIAEKKEVGEAIANAFSKMLNIPIQKKNGVNYVGGFTITALAGHVMKLMGRDRSRIKKMDFRKITYLF